MPAGGALAVDRDGFSQAVEAAIRAEPLITVERGEIAALPPPDWGPTIIATGPLTSPALAEAILAETGESALAFFDAIAPIVHYDSIDFDIAWRQSRYDKAGPGGDAEAYVNCPMDRATYEAFIDALLAAEKTEFREFEDTPYFDGCLPIEVMAERGRETLRHGPMKPVGLTNAHEPHAQTLRRRATAPGQCAGHLVQHGGLPDQAQIWRAGAHLPHDPGAGRAEFARLGGLHRNTFLNSPRLLDERLRLKARPQIRFAGQISGCEGYVESAAIGLLVGRLTAAEVLGQPLAPPPPTTALGALVNHITGGHIEAIDAGPRSFQPMNVNFGLFPPIAAPGHDAEGKRLRGPERGVARKRALVGARARRNGALGER